MEIQISNIRENDRERWQDLYRQYAEFYQVPMTQETLNTVWSWIDDPEEEMYCLLARDANGTPIGFMHYRAMLSPLKGTKIGFVDDLFVELEHRGKGAVDALFQALDSQARLFGWPIVRWITAEDNHRAQAAYKKIAEKTQWVTYQLNTNAVL